MPARSKRRKISTTISSTSEEFLKSLVRRGKASSMAEAVDHAVEIARRTDSRRRLEAATAAYYDSLSGKDLKAEQKLEHAVASAAKSIDVNGE
ncbi:MAG TPA: hypothetical protein VGF20_10455 [Candidatus Acidoferrum sp.]|jgi:Arc/MetJ-type ribon-helix-helix transcriptional regulator